MPAPLREALERLARWSLSASAGVDVLWLGHAWQVHDGDRNAYLCGRFESVWRDTPTGREKLPDRLVAIGVSLVFEKAIPDLPPTPGPRPEPERVAGNAWLHSEQIRSILECARDAYLYGWGEELPALLAPYREALALEAPAETGWGTALPQADYDRARLETATLLHRLESHLDYFGHPAGWAPLLSLRACLKLYAGELDCALRTLVLAQWVARKEAQEENTARFLDGAVQTLEQENRAAAGAATRAEARLGGLQAGLDSLQSDLFGLRDDLRKRRDELHRQAQDNLERQAWIDFAVSSFSAICSVIPVGQPALGAVGSLSKVVKDMATGGDPLEGTGQILEVLGKATATRMGEDAKRILADAEKAAKADKAGKQDPEKAAREAALGAAKEQADTLNKTAAKLGPAVGEISEAIQGLNVPQSEVDAELARLEAGDPLFVDLVARLRVVNDKKADFVDGLHEALQTLTESYARINANCATIASFDRQRGRKLALLDHDALRFVREMDQRARATLVKYLYYVVKSYEATLFEPLGGEEGSEEAEVQYRLTEVFDRIETLLDDEEGQDPAKRAAARFDPARLAAFVGQVRPLFEANLARIEESLLERYLSSGKERWGRAPARECRLSEAETPDVIRRLNAEGEAVIDLKALGVVSPDFERIRILRVDIPGDPKNRPRFVKRADAGTVGLTVEALEDGTVRSEGKLYAVRHPVQQVCGWAYHFSDDTLEAGEESRSSIALLHDLLERRQPAGPAEIAGSRDADLLLPPPAWTEVRVRYDTSYFQARHAQPPELKSLVLRFHFDALAAPPGHRVLDVRTVGPTIVRPGGGVGPVAVRPPIGCDPEDLGRKSTGRGDFWRIYSGATAVSVALTAPAALDGLVFDRWEYYRDVDWVTEPQPRLELRLGPYTQVFCYYRSAEPLAQMVLAAAPSFGAEAGPPLSARLLAGPSFEAGDVGCLLPGAGFTVLERETAPDGREWVKVDQRGRVGWTCVLPGAG